MKLSARMALSWVLEVFASPVIRAVSNAKALQTTALNATMATSSKTSFASKAVVEKALCLSMKN